MTRAITSRATPFICVITPSYYHHYLQATVKHGNAMVTEKKKKAWLCEYEAWSHQFPALAALSKLCTLCLATPAGVLPP